MSYNARTSDKKAMANAIALACSTRTRPDDTHRTMQQYRASMLEVVSVDHNIIKEADTVIKMLEELKRKAKERPIVNRVAMPKQSDSLKTQRLDTVYEHGEELDVLIGSRSTPPSSDPPPWYSFSET